MPAPSTWWPTELYFSWSPGLSHRCCLSSSSVLAPALSGVPVPPAIWSTFSSHACTSSLQVGSDSSSQSKYICCILFNNQSLVKLVWWIRIRHALISLSLCQSECQGDMRQPFRQVCIHSHIYWALTEHKALSYVLWAHKGNSYVLGTYIGRSSGLGAFHTFLFND